MPQCCLAAALPAACRRACAPARLRACAPARLRACVPARLRAASQAGAAGLAVPYIALVKSRRPRALLLERVERSLARNLRQELGPKAAQPSERASFRARTATQRSRGRAPRKTEVAALQGAQRAAGRLLGDRCLDGKLRPRETAQHSDAAVGPGVVAHAA